MAPKDVATKVRLLTASVEVLLECTYVPEDYTVLEVLLAIRGNFSVLTKKDMDDMIEYLENKQET